MGKLKKILIWVVVVILVVGGLVWGFLATGGIGLVRLYKNYLWQDLPNKQYSANNFRDRGPREMLSGYYAGSDGKGVYIWTLSGLKRFTHQDMTSVYYYLDICLMVRNLAKGVVEQGENSVYDETYFTLKDWRERVKWGDYVWVKRVGEGAESKVIDKIFANSKQTFPLDSITLRQCEE